MLGEGGFQRRVNVLTERVPTNRAAVTAPIGNGVRGNFRFVLIGHGLKFTPFTGAFKRAEFRTTPLPGITGDSSP